MKTIPVTPGLVALVDDEDYELVAQYRWQRDTSGGARGRVNGKDVRMHRLVMHAPPGVEVDHINHNRLDNRKINLRLCTTQQNQFNRKAQRGSSSRYKGVATYRDGRWRAQIRGNGTYIHLGYYDTEIEAARAYNAAARELYGDFAYLNDVDQDGQTPVGVRPRRPWRRRRG